MSQEEQNLSQPLNSPKICDYKEVHEKISVGEVILVEQGLDLKDLCRLFVDNCKTEVNKLMAEKRLLKPSPEFLATIMEENPKISIIEVLPYTLIQLFSDDP